ncbi:glucokinase [Rhizobium bangladeshense]|uniref:glucokinase n=1 Tax=Rhizobium bangladeshense TaxID=1138189 RepID=UPI0007E583EE|nr:glucokinase [Rhizobium bangladeshense]
MPTLSDRHAIVGEIGPTHLRFAVADIDELAMDHYVNFRTADFDSIELAVNAYLTSLQDRPARMSLAVAGDIAGGHARLFHRPWSFTAKQLQDAFSIPTVSLMRDIEAVSRSVPLLTQHDLLQIGGAISPPVGPKAILLVERDVEVAAAVPVGPGWSVLLGRAGDISFGAEDGDELLALDSMRRGPGRIALRNVLTSTGLSGLYDALRQHAGLTASAWGVSEIIEAASLEEPDPHARETLQRFAAWLGRFAADLAAAYGAEGGLYLAGSMPNDLRDVLTEGTFAASFMAAGGPTGFASTVPVHVVTASNVALRGAALALS